MYFTSNNYIITFYLSYLYLIIRNKSTRYTIEIIQRLGSSLLLTPHLLGSIDTLKRQDLPIKAPSYAVANPEANYSLIQATYTSCNCLKIRNTLVLPNSDIPNIYLLVLPNWIACGSNNLLFKEADYYIHSILFQFNRATTSSSCQLNRR